MSESEEKWGLVGFGKSGDTEVSVIAFDFNLEKGTLIGYEILIESGDLEIEFAHDFDDRLHIHNPTISEALRRLTNIFTSDQQCGSSGHPFCIVKDTEFPDRFWLDSGHGWRIKRSPEQVKDLTAAIEAAIQDLENRGGGK